MKFIGLKSLIGTLLALVLLNVGCDNSSANNSSTPSKCDMDFVEDYNAFWYEANFAQPILDNTYMQDNMKQYSLQNLSMACSRMYSYHKGVKCVDTSGYQGDEVIATTDIKKICDEVDDIFGR